MSQDFRLPILRMYNESTIGAHKSFMLYGHETKLKNAYIYKYIKMKKKNIYINFTDLLTRYTLKTDGKNVLFA